MRQKGNVARAEREALEAAEAELGLLEAERAAELPAPSQLPLASGILDLAKITGPSEPVSESPMTYSAPPSRSGSIAGSFSGQRREVTLTREEAEVAKLCGLSPIDYARQKLELARRKQLDPERYAGR